MAKCEFCDKGVTFGIKVSHSHRRSNRTWKPNVKRVKAIVDGSPKHVYVCTRQIITETSLSPKGTGPFRFYEAAFTVLKQFLRQLCCLKNTLSRTM